jgi:hypothetical protein
MVTHAPIPCIVGENLWDLAGWEAGWNLDLVWTCFLMGKFLSLPDHAFHNHFPNCAVMAHFGDEALLNRPSSRIEQFSGYFLVLCGWFSNMT